MQNEIVEIYRDEKYILCYENKIPYFYIKEEKYELSSHPYEPCTYIKRDGLCISIHNAFDIDYAFHVFQNKKTIISITGKEYSQKDFCTMLEYSLEGSQDTDISFVEGQIDIDKLISLGAINIENAIDLKTIGIRQISDRFHHSKKLEKRVMYTDDGKVYIKIKK